MVEILYQSAVGVYAVLFGVVVCAHPLLVVAEKLFGDTGRPRYVVGRARACPGASHNTVDS